MATTTGLTKAADFIWRTARRLAYQLAGLESSRLPRMRGAVTTEALSTLRAYGRLV